MDNKTLSKLIGLIYDTAFDINLWPRLLELLSDELESLLVEETEAYFVDPVADHIDYINISGHQTDDDNGTEIGAQTAACFVWRMGRVDLCDLDSSSLSRVLRSISPWVGS